MLQKFKKLSFVQIGPKVAIIDGSYSQIHGGTNIHDYQVYILKKDVLVIEDKKAWVNENDIEAINDSLQNSDLAEELIESYNLRQ